MEDKENMEQLLELYRQDYEVMKISYALMCKLVDDNFVKRCIEVNDLKSVYIYGGGYLGVQLYNKIKDLVEVVGIVDQSGTTVIQLTGVNIISPEQLKEEYKGQAIIVTPVKYYHMISDMLKEFTNMKDVFYLGVLLEGEPLNAVYNELSN